MATKKTPMTDYISSDKRGERGAPGEGTNRFGATSSSGLGTMLGRENNAHSMDREDPYPGRASW